MTDILNNFTFGEGGEKVSYPWETWIDGQTRRAVKGEDFHCEVDSFIAGLYRIAKRRNLTVQTHKADGACIFTFSKT